MIRYSTGARKAWNARQRKAITAYLLTKLIPALQLRYSPGQAVAINDGWLNGVGSSLDNMILEMRSGAQPLTADLAPTGTVGASITLPADAYSLTVNPGATAAKLGTWQDPSADANVTVAHLRIRTAGDAGTTNNTDRRIDGAITITGGGGECEIQNPVLAVGQQVTVNTATVTQPKQ